MIKYEAIVQTREFTFTKSYPTHEAAMSWVRGMMINKPENLWTIQEIEV